MDTREIARIVATNTVRIDLPIWLRSEPYLGDLLHIEMVYLPIASSPK